jgi:ribosome maturation factor RimP
MREARTLDLSKIREAADRVAGPAGIEVVDIEWKVGRQRLLRVYIDKPGGITHDDCQWISEQLGVILDVEDLVPGPRYILEVSSPGLDRRLRSPAEYERFAGRRVRLSLSEPLGTASVLEGRLLGLVRGTEVALEVGGQRLQIPLASIRKAQLVVEFPGERR